MCLPNNTTSKMLIHSSNNEWHVLQMNEKYTWIHWEVVSFSLTAWPFRFRLFRLCHSELWNWGEGLRYRRNAAFRRPHRSLQGRQVPDVGWQTQTFFSTGLTLSFIVTFQSSCIETYCHYFHVIFKKNSMLWI